MLMNKLVTMKLLTHTLTKKMQLTKAQEIKHSRKIERELQIDLGMNYNRHRS
jgi:hypothetical protein